MAGPTVAKGLTSNKLARFYRPAVGANIILKNRKKWKMEECRVCFSVSQAAEECLL